MINKHFNKRGDVAIVLLVFMTLALVLASLYIFSTSSSDISGKIVNSRNIDAVLAREKEIDFFVNKIAEKSASGNQQQFIEKFKEEIGKYRVEGVFHYSELLQINSQLDKEHIKINDNKIEMNFLIITKMDFSDFGKVGYIYNKKYTIDI